MAFTQVTVSQDYNSADGSEPTGTVTFTLSAAVANSGVVIPAVPVTRNLNGDGVVSLPLYANTDSGTAPAGTKYTVTELIGGVTRTFRISVPHDQGAGPLTLYNLVV